MKIGVYVGSFNPVHKGHVQTVKYLLKNNILDRVVIIPTLDYWEKTGLIALPHRVAMWQYYANEQIIIDERKSHFSYTYEILNEVKKENPNDELYLIIGADNIKQFHKWKKVDEILENHVMIMPRDGIDVNVFFKRYKKKDKFIIANGFKNLDISSTFIRENLQNRNMKKLENIIDHEVLDYIINNNLYKGE